MGEHKLISESRRLSSLSYNPALFLKSFNINKFIFLLSCFVIEINCSFICKNEMNKYVLNSQTVQTFDHAVWVLKLIGLSRCGCNRLSIVRIVAEGREKYCKFRLFLIILSRFLNKWTNFDLLCRKSSPLYRQNH